MARGAAALLLLAAAASAQRRRAQTTSGGAIFAFGRNNYGQLGLGSSSNALEPAELAALGTDNAVVSSGFYVVHVLKLSGAVHAFGRNNYGQLGIGTTSSKQEAPVEVTLLGTENEAISSGSCTHVLKSSGAVFAFGQNNYGQLGIGSTTNVNAPVEVAAPGADNRMIASGASHTYVLKVSGAVVGFGKNTNGELGLGSTINKQTPTEITALGTDNVLIASGGYHLHVLKVSGLVYGHGRNNYGQLGIGSTERQISPVLVEALGSQTVLLESGAYHTHAVQSSGAILACGQNTYGQLGIDSRVTQNSPVEVTLLGTDNAMIASGSYHTVRSPTPLARADAPRLTACCVCRSTCSRAPARSWPSGATPTASWVSATPPTSWPRSKSRAWAATTSRSSPAASTRTSRSGRPKTPGRRRFRWVGARSCARSTASTAPARRRSTTTTPTPPRPASSAARGTRRTPWRSSAP